MVQSYLCILAYYYRMEADVDSAAGDIVCEEMRPFKYNRDSVCSLILPVWMAPLFSSYFPLNRPIRGGGWFLSCLWKTFLNNILMLNGICKRKECKRGGKLKRRQCLLGSVLFVALPPSIYILECIFSSMGGVSFLLLVVTFWLKSRAVSSERGRR